MRSGTSCGRSFTANGGLTREHNVEMALIDDPSLTLSEGLDRYFQSNALLLTTRDVSDEAAQFLRCHDVAHVVFGCDTTLVGEGTVKLWTIFGTTLGFWKQLSAAP